MSDFLKHIYSRIASRYERINHIFSLGLDMIWRRRLAKMVVESGALRVLDVCTGTGETARYVARFARREMKIIATDFSQEMLNIARERSGGGIEYRQADTSLLPFPDGTFDAVTMSFATRNLNSGERPLKDYFKEIRRVLRDGGAFYNLETSRPGNVVVLFFFRQYVRFLVTFIGSIFSGCREGYRYLSSSTIGFMSADELALAIREAGFSFVGHDSMMLGTAAIHKAVK